MPRLISAPLTLVCTLVVFGALYVPAMANTIPVEVRVAPTNGNDLTDQIQYTGTTAAPTSPKARCFGRGTGGSGDPVRLTGPTALGAIVDAARLDPDLRPLSISDHFDFGLAVCGIGGFVARDGASWYLKVNHANPNLGGDNVRLRSGDEVLWYLAPSFPYPDELSLIAPARAEKGEHFSVRVFAYSDSGKRRPVAGAKVTGADLPTGSDGRTTVSLATTTNIVARRAGDIASNRAPVCVTPSCPAQRTRMIGGTSRRDLIHGTGGPNQVRAGAGDDRVDVRRGGPDRVNCGGGRDTVLLGPEDLAGQCEVRFGK